MFFQFLVDLLIVMRLCGCPTMVAKALIEELNNWFPTSYLVDVMGLVYPQYWFQKECEESFMKHINFIKAHYYYGWELDVQFPPILSRGVFDLQVHLFKVAMKTNVVVALEPPHSSS